MKTSSFVWFLVVSTAMGACSMHSSEGCTGNDECDPGFICQQNACFQVCAADSDCEPGEICSGELCAEGARDTAPVIVDIDGNSTNPDVFVDGLVVQGENLEGASAVLIAEHTQWNLKIRSSNATRLEAILPPDLVAGDYALSVVNAVGEDQGSVSVLKGEKGDPGDPQSASGVLTLLQSLGSPVPGLDAETVGGLGVADLLPADGGTITGDLDVTGSIRAGSVSGALASSNSGAVGLETNILFNAPVRYRVTQTGPATLGLASLFDGRLMPAYSANAPAQFDEQQFLIEDLPPIHTQTGAWVGFTTRYWGPDKFVVQGFNTWENANKWETFADYSDTPYTGGNRFVVPVQPGGVYTKLRIRIYHATGTDGRLGLSEIFFLHPEAARIYSGILPSQLWEGANGYIGIGVNDPKHPVETAAGAFVTTGGVWTNASSRALKRDIEPLSKDEEASLLSKLMDTDVVHFRYKKDAERRQLGLIAEDVPDEMSDAGRKGIPTANAIAFLAGALKAQQRELEMLRQEVSRCHAEPAVK